jgi:hypothetical protein
MAVISLRQVKGFEMKLPGRVNVVIDLPTREKS